MSPLLAVNAASPATPDLPNTPPKSFADTADAHSNRNCPRLHVCLPKKTQLVQQKEEKAKKKIDLNDTVTDLTVKVLRRHFISWDTLYSIF
jgi:hypothetical protein